MTESETKRIATAAAREALQEFFLTIGVNVASPEAIIELQRDFHHIRSARKTVGNVRNKAWDVLTGSAVTGILATVGYYLTHTPK
ncbi:putative phage-like protein YoqJ [Bradyrhizobium embrapense]